MENIKADAVRRSGELEIKLAEMTQHSEAIRTQSKAVEERLTEEGLTRDLARRALEQEMERIKEDAALRFKEHKIKLAEITRHAETTQANLNIVEECVTGWKARCHEVESERDRAKADVEKLTQFRQDQLNIAETCVIGWKDQCQQVKSELSQMREAYESLSGAHRERSQLIEERKRQLDEITATAEKDQEDLKRHIEVILGERDRATAELNRQSKGHQQALLDIEQKHEARIGALRDTNDITTVTRNISLYTSLLNEMP
jgi:chromosome segregation ATPase